MTYQYKVTEKKLWCVVVRTSNIMTTIKHNQQNISNRHNILFPFFFTRQATMIENRILCIFSLLEKLRIGFVLNEKENVLCLNFAFQFSQNSPPHANSSNKIIGISNSTVITSYTVVHTLVIFFIFVYCPIMCLFVLCSVL